MPTSPSCSRQAGRGRDRQRLQAVVDASDEVAVIATDTDGTITLFNTGRSACWATARRRWSASAGSTPSTIQPN
jgi:hypothetical protein